MLLLSRTAARSARIPTARLTTCRFLSSEGPLPVDVEHYTSGWNIEDIQDFTKPGKYNVATYNKISPLVRHLQSPMWGLIMCKDALHLCKSLPHTKYSVGLFNLYLVLSLSIETRFSKATHSLSAL